MPRVVTFVVTMIAALAIGATAVLAQNPHFVRGPTFTDLGTQLQVTGRVAGLGSEPLRFHVVADGVATVECINPGGNRAPGQDTEVPVEGSTATVSPDRRGQFTIQPGQLVTDEPTVTGAQACPNAKWTADVTDVEFSNIRIFLEQPIGSPLRQIYP